MNPASTTNKTFVNFPLSESTIPMPVKTSTASFLGPEPFEGLFYVRNIQCNSENCALPYATCLDANTCKCLEGFANFTPDEVAPSSFFCFYTQKKQVVAFLLEFFVGAGVGHLYSGRILFGIFKMSIFIGPLIIGCFMCLGITIFEKMENATCFGMTMIILAIATICTGLVWQLTDIIIFGVNNYLDGNGVPLLHW